VHGHLTLLLLPHLAAQTYRIEGTTAAINYGLNRVRFVQAVPVGASIRDRTRLLEVDQKSGAAVQSVIEHRVELDGSDKPACLAETITHYVFG
jgi:acyl dehydratase